ncbi:MAG: hypothetical protein JO043_00055 [Candidatus Eremiobacteraeota bacterium]|nr:hypothetical protein [Candidatus Eremiobacteraeota bacterium]
MNLARITLAAVVGGLGTLSIASANGTEPNAPAVRSKPFAVTCNSQSFTSGCVSGTNTSQGIGVYGRATGNGWAVEGQSDGVNAAVTGYNDSTAGGYGVYSRSLQATSLYSYADVGIGVFAESEGSSTSASLPLLVKSGTFGGNLILGQYGNSVMFQADTFGNLTLQGQLFTAGACHAGCSRTRHVRSFASRTTQPTIEDVGEATLRSGEAHVALDPSFANVIDSGKQYVVFLTPEGDATDLYVTSRTRTGFEVRESHGRASVPFAYRIVAKPYGVRDERLPLLEDPRLPYAPVRPQR